MKPVRLAFSALFAAATAAVLLPATARAQYGTGYGQQNTGPDPALIEARKQIQAAEKDVARLRQEQQKVKSKLQAKYDAMGQDLSSYLDGLLNSDYLTYWDYIHLDT